MPSMRKVRSSVKNKRKNATDERSVQNESEDKPAHEIQPERVEESLVADCNQTRLDSEATGSQSDGKRQPEASVGRECCSTKGATPSHLPDVKLVSCKRVLQPVTTYHMPASSCTSPP